MRYFSATLWVLPFLSFIAGYVLLHSVSYREVVQAPAVVGLPLAQAVKVLSGCRLNARILTEKEDADLPEGSVISQSPVAGKKIKAYQSIFLVVTRHADKAHAPLFSGLMLSQVQARAQEHNIHLKTYYLPAQAPYNTCIAQNVAEHEELDTPAMLVYVSQGAPTLRVFPTLKQHKVAAVTKFLKNYGLTVITNYVNGRPATPTKHSRVLEQYPAAGSLVDIIKLSSVLITISDPAH
jgi:beta-lactam-binding protein with PASTA domain